MKRMIYSLEELKEKNIDGYLKVIQWMRVNVGCWSNEALEKYAKDDGMFADVDGNIYRLHHEEKRIRCYKYKDAIVVDYNNKTYQVIKNGNIKDDDIYTYILVSSLYELKLKEFLKENNFKRI